MIDHAGERLILRTMTRADYHNVRRKYVSDPLMEETRFTYDAAAVDAVFDQMQTRLDWFIPVGVFRTDGEIIGEMCFKRVDRAKGRCELGIVLANDSYKGRGYGTEAFALAMDYALGVLGLRALYADTMGSNLPMQRVLEKLGFRCYLRLEDCYDMGDRLEDRLDYIFTPADAP